VRISGKDVLVRQPSPRTYLLVGSLIAGALLTRDLARLVATGRIPSGELRHAALTAAGVLFAVGLSSRQTHRTLDLARRLERARTMRSRDATVVPLPTALWPG